MKKKIYIKNKVERIGPAMKKGMVKKVQIFPALLSFFPSVSVD